MDRPDWLTKPTLTGSRAKLRPFGEQDFPAIGAALADPEVLRLTGSIHSAAEAAGRRPVLDERGLEWYRGRNTADERLDLAIVEFLFQPRCFKKIFRSRNFRVHAMGVYLRGKLHHCAPTRGFARLRKRSGNACR